NQQPRHAFCRKERAENVTVFRTLPAPDPNPQLKAQIIQAMISRDTERMRERAASQQDTIGQNGISADPERQRQSTADDPLTQRQTTAKRGNGKAHAASRKRKKPIADEDFLN